MKRLIMVVSIAAAGMLPVSGIGTAEGQTEVTICHYSKSTDTFAPELVSEKSVDMHVEKHGDALPGDPVPGMEGYEFDGDCTAVGICLDSSQADLDIRYIGLPNTMHSVRVYNSVDGTCSGGINSFWGDSVSLVIADTSGEAAALCAGFGQILLENAAAVGYSVPDTYWHCY